MAQNVTIGGTIYQVPDTGEKSWGDSTTSMLVALAAISGSIDATKQNTLTADAVFTGGVNPNEFGLIANHFKSASTLTAIAGVLRLRVGDTVSWRNNADSADLALSIDGSDLLSFSGVAISTISSTDVLTNKSIDSDNNTITNLVNADIKALAAIDATKIADGSVTSTEFQYLGDVTSLLQVQLDSKAADADLTSHENDVANPHVVTQTQVGLSDVDNTSDADKPVSTAQQTALDLKTDVTTFDTHTGDVANPHVVTQTQVGLSNVDNTTDLLKPLSTAAIAESATKEDVLPLTTRGDVLIRDAANATDRLAAGTEGQVLTSDGTDISWADAGGGLSLEQIVFGDSPVTAAIGKHYQVDTTGGVVVFNLPDLSALTAAQQTVAIIAFSDCADNWAVNETTLVPFSGDSIDSEATDDTLSLDVEAQNVEIARQTSTNWCLDTNFQPVAIDISGLPTSDDVDATKQFLVPQMRQTTVTLDNDFTGGERLIKITRIGDVVTITGKGIPTHSSSGTVNSSVGLIPDWARPLTSTTYMGYFSTSIGATANVTTSGRIGTQYSAPRVDTIIPINITYTII